MTYRQALAHLASIRERGILPGLSRITRLLAILGNPQDGLLLVHVAGTNGKGSVCACLEACLLASGHRTGLFSSPWLVDPEEMFRIGGRSVSRALFARAVSEVEKAARDMAGGPGLPSEYECYAAMAFWLFREAACRVVVLETCMGGRYDTTNAYSGPNLAVLTSLSLDHMGYLGDTLTQIAWHKAGIFRQGCRAVSAAQVPEAGRQLAACARETGTDLMMMDEDAVSRIEPGREGTRFHLSGSWPGTYQVSLVGVHQAENAALAIHALHALNCWQPSLSLNPDRIREGLRRVDWPCRFEVISGHPTVVIDGAHNPDGMRRFTESFRAVFPFMRPVVVMGVLKDKDVRGMLEPLCTLAGHLLAITPDSPRAMPGGELALLAGEMVEKAGGCCPVVKHDTIQEAMDAGMRLAHPDSVLVAVGSLTWVGRFRHLLLSRAHAPSADPKGCGDSG